MMTFGDLHFGASPHTFLEEEGHSVNYPSRCVAVHLRRKESQWETMPEQSKARKWALHVARKNVEAQATSMGKK